MGKNKTEKLDLRTLPAPVLKNKKNGNMIHKIKNMYVLGRFEASHYDLTFRATTNKSEKLKKLYIKPNLKHARNCCLAIKNGKVSDVLPRTAMEAQQQAKEDNEIVYANELEIKGFALNTENNEIVEIE